MRFILVTLTFAALSAPGASAADVKAGQATYQKSCRSCHGPDGAGNPAMAKMMKVEMRDLKSPEVQAMSNADLEKIVTNGKGKMKPITAVTGPSVADVAAYVHSMKK